MPYLYTPGNVPLNQSNFFLHSALPSLLWAKVHHVFVPILKLYSISLISFWTKHLLKLQSSDCNTDVIRLTKVLFKWLGRNREACGVDYAQKVPEISEAIGLSLKPVWSGLGLRYYSYPSLSLDHHVFSSLGLEIETDFRKTQSQSRELRSHWKILL